MAPVTHIQRYTGHLPCMAPTEWMSLMANKIHASKTGNASTGGNSQYSRPPNLENRKLVRILTTATIHTQRYRYDKEMCGFLMPVVSSIKDRTLPAAAVNIQKTAEDTCSGRRLRKGKSCPRVPWSINTKAPSTPNTIPESNIMALNRINDKAILLLVFIAWRFG